MKNPYMNPQIQSFFLKILFLGFLSFSEPASARTILSGSFVRISLNKPSATIGINYPNSGSKSICALELKTHTMVMHRRVYDTLASGLVVKLEDGEKGAILQPEVLVFQGPRLIYPITPKGIEYANVLLSVKNKGTLVEYFNTVLGEDAEVLASVVHCGEMQGTK